jgi:hypothetical protein
LEGVHDYLGLVAGGPLHVAEETVPALRRQTRRKKKKKKKENEAVSLQLAAENDEAEE